MPKSEIHRITVTEKLWERIAESVPRNWKGELYSWCLRQRVDALINKAIDKEQNRNFKSGAV